MSSEPAATVPELGGDAEREEFFAAHPELESRATLVAICDRSVAMLRSDLDRAAGLVETAAWLARRLDDEYGWGRVHRARANLCLFRRDNRGAVRENEAALERFERAGEAREAAITRSGAVQGLINLGQYERAGEWISAARGTFEELDDKLQLAILDFNEGALLARQDRHGGALERFRSAHERFLAAGSPNDVAISLRNIAVSLQDLNRLEEAEEAYRRASRQCSDHELRHLGLEVGCNAAYLHFLRGEYARALRDFDAAREASRELADPHHEALCDLEQAEIYLELNLPVEAEGLARRAFEGFDRLGMAYESAKALSFEALALGRRGGRSVGRALELLEQARASFAAEGNRIWPARIDLHRAFLLYAKGDDEAARRLAEEALERLRPVPSLDALARILLARLDLERGDPDAALERIRELFDDLARRGLRSLEFRVLLLRGRAQLAAGEPRAALESLRAAEARLDELRGRLVADELKVAYLEDKQEVYEALVALTAGGPPSVRSPREAFHAMERSKSRSLADLLTPGIQALPARTAAGSELAAEIRRLRAEVAGLERRLDAARAGEEAVDEERLAGLARELRAAERALLAALRRAELVDREFGSLQTAAAVDAEAVQGLLPSEARLVEYHVAAGRLRAAVVGPGRLEIVTLCEAERVEELVDSLRFQLAKFARGPGFPEVALASARRAVEARLAALHGELIAPLERLLDGRHLVVVPHGVLHALPFHALGQGDDRLLDRCTVSYVQSATVLKLCAERQAAAAGPALVLGVTDDKAPLIAREAEAVAAALPGSRLLLGAEASRESLGRWGAGARYLHVATHGFFRGDHPMFSAVQLGDGRMSVVDLYGLELGAELVVLSGCSTGLNVVRPGDELVGLSRGLLYAGARALVSTLWDVHDESTAALMSGLYSRLSTGEAAPAALAGAIRELRESSPEPYYWAPFVLSGWPFG